MFLHKVANMTYYMFEVIVLLSVASSVLKVVSFKQTEPLSNSLYFQRSRRTSENLKKQMKLDKTLRTHPLSINLKVICKSKSCVSSPRQCY